MVRSSQVLPLTETLLASMMQMLGDVETTEDTVSMSLYLLGRMAQDGGVEASLHAGAATELVKLLRRPGLSDETLRAACEVIAILATEAVGNKAFGRAGAVEAVVALLASPGEEMVVQACRTLSFLARDDDNERAAGRAGALNVLLGLLRRKAGEDLRLAACIALQSLVFDEANREAAVREGAVEVIIDELQRPGASDPMLEAACVALYNLVQNSAAAERAGLAGAVETTKGLLERDDLQLGLAESATLLMGGLVHTSSVETGRAAVLGLMISMITRFPGSKTVKKHASYTVCTVGLTLASTLGIGEVDAGESIEACLRTLDKLATSGQACAAVEKLWGEFGTCV